MAIALVGATSVFAAGAAPRRLARRGLLLFDGRHDVLLRHRWIDPLRRRHRRQRVHLHEIVRTTKYENGVEVGSAMSTQVVRELLPGRWHRCRRHRQHAFVARRRAVHVSADRPPDRLRGRRVPEREHRSSRVPNPDTALATRTGPGSSQGPLPFVSVTLRTDVVGLSLPLSRQSQAANASPLTCKSRLAYRGVVGTDEVFKALAEPTRRTILDELADRDDQTLFEICASWSPGVASTRQAISSTSTCSRRPV